MILILAALIFGIISNNINNLIYSFIFLILSIAFIIIFIKLLKSNKNYICIILLPIVILIGRLSMFISFNEKELIFDDKQEAQITGIVLDIAGTGGKNQLYLTNSTIFINNTSSRENKKIILYLDDITGILPGDYITCSGKLYHNSKAVNPGMFDGELYYKCRNVAFKFYCNEIICNKPLENDISNFYFQLKKFIYLARVKVANILKELLPEDESGIAISLVIGDKALLEDEIKELYKEGGILHILSISGLHISFIGMGMFRIMRNRKLSLMISSACTLLFLIIYGMFAGFSISTTRAILMIVIDIIGRCFGKVYDSLSGISFTAFIILLFNPYYLYDCGFLLSFITVYGILITHECLDFNRIFKEYICNKYIKKFVSAFISGICIQLFTLPLIMFFYYEIPIYSFLTNILVIPVCSILLLFSCLSSAIGLFSIFIGRIFASVPYYIFNYIYYICKLISDIPGNKIITGRPELWKIIIYYITTVAALICIKLYFKGSKYNISILKILCRNKNIIISLCMLFLFVSCSIFFIKDENNLQIEMLDIGQGDCIYIDDMGTNAIIDCGSSNVKNIYKYRIEPFLKSSGVSKLDYIFISHPDSDHMNGINDIIEFNNIAVNNLVISIPNYQDKQYYEISNKLSEIISAAQNKNINIIDISDKEEIQLNKAKLICINPCNDICYSSLNSFSQVLLLKDESFNMLFTGDVDKEGEEHIYNVLKKYIETDILDNIDVLKVAHHGSNNSTQEKLLKLIRPSVSIISCSNSNRYGHPGEKTLKRLDNIHSKVFITKDCGAISIKYDKNKICVKGFI